MRDEFIDIVRGYQGSPFEHQGRSRQGIDCIGLFVVPAKAVGISTHDCRSYSRFGRGANLVEELQRAGLEVTSKMEAGNILVFWITNKHVPRHIGILSGEKTFVHTHSGVNRVVETTLDERWRKRIYCVMKHPELT